jgi:hypothetical protein
VVENHAFRARRPGHTAVLDVLSRQHVADDRSPLARLLGVSPLRDDARQPFRRALGAVLVGEALAGLGVGWDCVHDIPPGPGTGRLDHLLIGPSGVFAVASVERAPEDTPGAHAPGGGSTVSPDMLHTAAREAQRAAIVLSDAVARSVRVVPVIAVGPGVRVASGIHAGGVLVVRARDVVRAVTTRRTVLSGEEIAELSDLVDRPDVWWTSAAPAFDTASLYREFAALRSRVRSARRRRALWAVLGFAALWAEVCVIVGVAASLMLPA